MNEEHDIIITVRASCKGDPRKFKKRIEDQLETLANPDRQDDGLTLIGRVTIQADPQ